MYACVSNPETSNNEAVLNKRYTTFHSHYIALVNIMDRRGLSSKAHHEYLPKETKVTLCMLAIHFIEGADSS